MNCLPRESEFLVRGLFAGAPVEYRGIRVGSVRRIMLEELMDADLIETSGEPIPVLIAIDPGRLGLPDDPGGVEMLQQSLATDAGNGLRASLASGNLLTGSLFVSIDFYPDEEPGDSGT